MFASANVERATFFRPQWYKRFPAAARQRNPSRMERLAASFREIRPAYISIIARVSGDTFERYRTSNGKTISKLSMGTLSMENMFGDAHDGNSFATWILRFLGIGLVVTGLGIFFAPLSIIAAFIPLLGAIVSAGTGIVCLLLGLSWSLVIMSVAWFRFRPLEGAVMLLIASGLAALLYRRGRKKKAVAQIPQT